MDKKGALLSFLTQLLTKVFGRHHQNKHGRLATGCWKHRMTRMNCWPPVTTFVLYPV